jgi:hypothetical protein
MDDFYVQAYRLILEVCLVVEPNEPNKASGRFLKSFLQHVYHNAFLQLALATGGERIYSYMTLGIHN